MIKTTLNYVRINGIASAVPKNQITIEEDAQNFDADEIQKMARQVGLKKRHIATNGMCSSDLCVVAAKQLLEESNTPKDSIDGIIFVSQTPDYPLPPTSCVIHERLDLNKSCAAFDVNQGCTGYIYGVWLAANLIASGSLKRVLLLVGDTISQYVSPKDRSVFSLFGDAGSATLLEYDAEAPQLYCSLGTDGSGHSHLIVPSGGARTLKSDDVLNDGVRGGEHLSMNGAEIFAFSLREVPKMLQGILSQACWDLDHVDHWVLHQANRFMLQHLGRLLNIPPDKMPLAIEEYGNTTSASIPLTINHALRESLTTEHKKIILSGFGVGLSWGAIALETESLILPTVIEVENL
jgi:3-oxoacyl-[acyl-carrier-protein] synthase-3